MPRKLKKVPSYTRHKASGQAVVRIDGKDHYLGRYGDPDSYAEYERLIAEWRVQVAEAARAGNSPAAKPQTDLTVNALVLAYLKFAEGLLNAQMLAESGQNPRYFWRHLGLNLPEEELKSLSAFCESRRFFLIRRVSDDAETYSFA